jgi:hypothetical protein
MTGQQRTLRVFGVALAAFGVGVLDSLIKGQGGGLIGALSQTVAPWFLLAFLAGALNSDRRYVLGAFAGLGATMLALVGFYAINSLYFPWLGGFYSVLLAGKVYFEFGLLSGPFFGAFGAWWKQHLSLVPVIALGVAFVLEALARVLQTNRVFGYADQVAVIEAVVGAVWIALALYTTVQLRERHSLERVR